MVTNVDHGLQDSNACIPFSQKWFRSAGLNPDIIDTLGCDDIAGNPSVDLRFQKSICGG